MAPLTILTRALLVAGLAGGSPALASGEYLEEIIRVLEPCAIPRCAFCHAAPGPDNGTATRPFAVSAKSVGLTGRGNLLSLRAALITLQQRNTDSDGDGVPDIMEIKQGSDPSDASSRTSACTDGGAGAEGGGGGSLPQPSFGCGAAAVALFPLLLILAVVRRRA